MENLVSLEISTPSDATSGDSDSLRFSVVIPTRNRPEWLKQVLSAILEQDFNSFEAVVVDNSDPENSSTAAAVTEFTSTKLRYVRTGGLTMAENWQAAVKAALGEYFIICSDKLILVPNLLSSLDKIIMETGGRVMVWKIGGASDCVSKASPQDPVRTIPGAWIWQGAVQGAWRVLHDAGARGMNSAIQRSIVAEVEDRLGVPFCRPCTPDYTIAITLGALGYPTHFLDRVGATFLPNAHGTGLLALMAPDDQTVRKQFSVPEVVGLPVKFATGINLIYQDICLLNEVLPATERLPINWEMYFIQLIHQAANADAMGGFGAARKEELMSALRAQPLRFRMTLFKTVLVQETLNLIKGKWGVRFQIVHMARLLRYAFAQLFR